MAGWRWFLLRILKPFVFTAALIPLLKIPYDALLGSGLTADPIAEVLNRLGFWTLTLLTVTLACTPAKILFGVKWPLRIRRMLGLFAFLYAALHFSFYVAADQFFDLRAILGDIAKRKFILVGFAAFLILGLLAATSPKRAVRRLGYVRWKRIHRLVYVAAALGLIHFVWRVKADLREPMIFVYIIGGLMLVRAVAWGLALLSRKKEDPGPTPTARKARGRGPD